MRADFAPFEAKMRAASLPEPAIRSFAHYYELLASGEAGLLPEARIEPVGGLTSAAELPERPRAAREALERAVVVKLNGGLGTSMGMRQAKSLLQVKGELTFLDLIARQVLELRRRHGAKVPLLLMNSFRTREDSLTALRRHPELAGDLAPDFLQHKVPRIRADDLSPVSWPEDPELEWCPPGHGDLYLALLTSGLLATLLERDFAYAFVSNADNLGAVLDPRILGWFAEEGAPFAMEVCPRTEAHRKGGHLARLRGGGLVLREVAQCPEEDLGAFQDVTRHRWFNTNNLWVDLRALERALHERGGVLGLPMIRNEKHVDPAEPGSPRVVQLETAMGAALSVFPGARALCVPGHRFAPVKTTSDLLAVRSDAFELAPDARIVPAGGAEQSALVVDLDPAHYGTVEQLDAHFPDGPPSLAACRRFTVRGDVRFAAGVVCRGDVALRADAPARVAAGSVLEGERAL